MVPGQDNNNSNSNNHHLNYHNHYNFAICESYSTIHFLFSCWLVAVCRLPVHAMEGLVVSDAVQSVLYTAWSI